MVDFPTCRYTVQSAASRMSIIGHHDAFEGVLTARRDVIYYPILCWLVFDLCATWVCGKGDTVTLASVVMSSLKAMKKCE